MLSPLLPLARDALLVLLGLPEEFCLEVRGGVGQSGLALVRSLDAGCLAFTRYFLYFLVESTLYTYGLHQKVKKILCTPMHYKRKYDVRLCPRRAVGQ